MGRLSRKLLGAVLAAAMLAGGAPARAAGPGAWEARADAAWAADAADVSGGTADASGGSILQEWLEGLGAQEAEGQEGQEAPQPGARQAGSSAPAEAVGGALGTALEEEGADAWEQAAMDAGASLAGGAAPIAMEGQAGASQEGGQADGQDGAADGEEAKGKDMAPMSVSDGDARGRLRDGYTEMRMKAQLSKDRKRVKLSWAPDKKDPEQRMFKKYALYMINEKEDGWEESPAWPASGKLSSGRSCTVEVGGLDRPPVFLLKCYGQEARQHTDHPLALYATVAAPYLISAQNEGDSTYSLTFNSSIEGYSATYVLEAARKNAEAQKSPQDGFREAWATQAAPGDARLIESYALTGKLSVPAMSAVYSNAEPFVEKGGRAYFRIHSVYEFNGEIAVRSSPSNVASAKRGPAKCRVFDVAGIKYDKEDAKSNFNSENRARAEKYLNGKYAEYSYGSGQPQELFIHSGSRSACADSGMIFFFSPAGEGELKGFNLLRSTSQHGGYKKLKTYSLSKAADAKLVWKCSGDSLKEFRRYASDVFGKAYAAMDVWCMEYTKFPMEAPYYYTVQAISSTKSTPGGMGNGYGSIATCGKVSGLAALESSSSCISLLWEHDHCAKEYWVYRVRTEDAATGDAVTMEEQLGRAYKIAAVPASKKKKEKHLDASGRPVETLYLRYDDKTPLTDVDYSYYVRPVFDKKKAAAGMAYNAAQTAGPVTACASAALSQVKDFTASNYGTGRVQLKWKQLKGITAYNVWRLPVTPDVKKLTDEMKASVDGDLPQPWEFVGSFASSGTSTSSMSVYDTDVWLGQHYFYGIQPATYKSAGLVNSFTGRVKAAVLGVANARAVLTDDCRPLLTFALNNRDWGIRDDIYIYINGVLEGNGYTDYTWTDSASMNAGDSREYRIEARCLRDGLEYASTATVLKCRMPSSYRIETSSGESIDGYAVALDYGRTITLKVKGLMPDGDQATFAPVKFTGSSINVAGFSVDNGFKDNPIELRIYGNSPGEAYINMTAPGYSRSIPVIVR